MATTDTTQPATSPAEVAADAADERLAERLVDQAKTQGVSLIGPDGLLHRVARLVLENALEGERTSHLGYEHGDPAGRNGGNSRNGSRDKTVITEAMLARVTEVIEACLGEALEAMQAHAPDVPQTG